METNRLCPNCGKPLEPGAPKGLCPACLMQGAFPTGTDPGGASPRFIPPSVAELAARFPHMEILELIGQGGMGAVYKARQKELDRIVALKILPPDIGGDVAFAERFAREAKALAKLNHPGIVTIFDFGRADGLYFFLMEYVDGVNLRQLLQRGRVSPREALAIVPQICDALQYAHDQGIVHRDIKPENILLDRRGRVKVADFGLAKIVAGTVAGVCAPGSAKEPATSELTEAGKIMGTPQYMSPEQIDAPGEVDHRADIYALGVVFYQMLTGELPGTKIEPPSRKVQIDVRLDEVVLRALENKPELRYQQASILRTQVETIASSPAEASPGPKVASPEKWLARFLSRWRRIVALFLGGITFTSPLSIKLANLSAIGFLGCLSYLDFLHPVMRGFGGFFGFFGLIGIVAIIEFPAARRRARGKKRGVLGWAALVLVVIAPVCAKRCHDRNGNAKDHSPSMPSETASSQPATHDFVAFFPAKYCTAVLNASRDFISAQHWQERQEGGNVRCVTIEALDGNGKRISFTVEAQAKPMARFTVSAEPGSEMPATLIGARLDIPKLTQALQPSLSGRK